ncbi:hypothetical protein IU438_03020 [Nocardia cyriacigeorgica]|uniref:hypothetical protein n=1 Tax=Nocardia cyriacigeorgica TaxID=135487 RepID=UPI0018963080|nr:hypothetical protein [Nocardia cyriacigeorgica]MBF6085517.1 hypothetical protein [Nocardia cyriacigeorgica]MBF6091605.1 hypothetical protein [Nocardia cyriacigeorgica]MBF6394759.1 hypothetical protein [Nocardia cyriacigeorgica]MBF6400393.1 hypothetical protein [Nocardia cyriacigeorgica]
MNRLVTRTCAAAAVVAAIGFAAAPAGAAPGLPLESASPAAVFAPETGSAGVYNHLMCYLHTISASVPCMYT